MAERLRIVVAGGLAAMPYAGVAWQVLQHLEGFRRLGHRVFYLEDTERWPYDPQHETVCDSADPAVDYLSRLLAAKGFSRWAYRDVASATVYGVGEQALTRELASADVLVNLSAVTALRDEHLRIPRRVYLETDPVLPQIEIAQGNARTIQLLDAHTHHFTYAENLGAPDCGVPLSHIAYQPTRPPVIVDWWSREAPRPRRRSAFTTIANWRQRDKDVTFEGRRLTWSKDVQFLALQSLPREACVPLELALALDDERPLARLRQAGWRVRSARPLSLDIDAYRRYVRASAGEFSVAKEQNIALRSGWFSDRTATYLAAGRPAVVQDTGFGRALPLGRGLFAFTTREQAIDALAEIDADYPAHCLAARELALEHLQAETVLGTLLERVGGGGGTGRATSATPAGSKPSLVTTI